MFSLGDFRAPALSLSVTRDDLVSEEEFELFMRLLGTYCDGLRTFVRLRTLDGLVTRVKFRAIVLNVAGDDEMMRLTIV